MDCLVLPIQSRVEDWKKITNLLDKEHHKGKSLLFNSLQYQKIVLIYLFTNINLNGFEILSGFFILHRLQEIKNKYKEKVRTSCTLEKENNNTWFNFSKK